MGFALVHPHQGNTTVPTDVSKKSRPPLGDRPMSPAERKRRQRILDKS